MLDVQHLKRLVWR